MKMNVIRIVLMSAILFFAGISPSWAFQETFDTNSSNLAVDYPQFTLSGFGEGAVVNQQLQLHSFGDPTGGQYVGLTTNGAFSGALDITVDATSTGGTPGDHNVLLYLGDGDPGTTLFNTEANGIVFHPGFAGAAVRVEGPGGFSNILINHTFAQDVMHEVDVMTDGLGNFSFTITDGNDPSFHYTNSWFNPVNTNFHVGMWTVDIDAGGPSRALFDNLSVTSVPEPSTILLLGAGLAGVGILRRRFKK